MRILGRIRTARYALAAIAAIAALVALLATPAAAAGSAATVGPSMPAPGGADGTDRTITLTSGVLTRTYTLFVPTHPAPRPWLVIDLHWYTGTAAAAEQQHLFDAKAAATGAIVAYPQGIGNHWNAGGCCGLTPETTADDVAFITTVINDVLARYPVDPSKIAIGGYSNGGGMAIRYACERSDMVSAVFIGSGDIMSPTCHFTKPLAFIEMHGLADTTLPWAGLPVTPGLTTLALPPLASVLGGFAAMDGCTGWTKSTLAAGVVQSIANCTQPGAAVWSFTSPTMGHLWPTSAADYQTYGLENTGLTWYFLWTRFR